MKVHEILSNSEDSLVLLGLAPPKKSKKGKKQKFFGPFGGVGFVHPTPTPPESGEGDGGSDGGGDGGGGGE